MRKTTPTLANPTQSDDVPEIENTAESIPEDWRSLKNENDNLKMFLEHQNAVMGVIMTKYREHVDSLSKTPSVDLSKISYRRFLNALLDQSSKTDEMKKLADRNLQVIFKYEAILSEAEAENESLRRRLELLSDSYQMLMSSRDLNQNSSSQTGLYIDGRNRQLDIGIRERAEDELKTERVEVNSDETAPISAKNGGTNGTLSNSDVEMSTGVIADEEIFDDAQ